MNSSALVKHNATFVYFLSSLRGQTAKTLIRTKSGVSTDSSKSAEKCRKVRRTALFAQKMYKKCAKSAVLRTFRHFSALFLESAETPLFVQINVFAVWPLRLDRKYTNVACIYQANTCPRDLLCLKIQVRSRCPFHGPA